MRTVVLLVALAAPRVFAAVDDIKFTLDFGNIHVQRSSSASFKLAIPTGADGKPISPVRAAFIERMNAARAPKQPHWSDDYEVVCQAQSSFEGEIYAIESLDPEKMDPGIAWAAKDIDAFYTGEYPGGFTAEEKGMRLVKVGWEELNEKVRRWVRENGEQRSFLVKNGVCFFAPGAVLEFLPLFIEEEGVGGAPACGGVFENLERYGKDVGGERVSGGIMGKLEIGSSVSLQLRAEKMAKKEKDGKESGGKDEL